MRKKVIISLAVILILSCISYNTGSSDKLNTLVERKIQEQVSSLQQQDLYLTSEIADLSGQKENIAAALAEKSYVQASIDEYNANKEAYTAQISQLTGDINNLDDSISGKQAELDLKIAQKQEEMRQEAARQETMKIIAEQSDSETVTRSVPSSSNSGETTVWIGKTGTKYHYENCPTLRSTKYEITLEEALEQGRAPCKVCH